MYRGMHCCPPNTLVNVPNVLEVVSFYAQSSCLELHRRDDTIYYLVAPRT
jgi:hypothetical protein